MSESIVMMIINGTNVTGTLYVLIIILRFYSISKILENKLLRGNPSPHPGDPPPDSPISLIQYS